MPLRRKCIELESIVCPQYSAVKGKSGVIALGYCVPLSCIFMLIESPKDLLILQYHSVPITLIWLNKIASYESRNFLLLARRVLGSYRLPLALSRSLSNSLGEIFSILRFSFIPLHER